MTGNDMSDQDPSRHAKRVHKDRIARAWMKAFETAPSGFAWEPKAVEERLVDAIRLIEKISGPTGPRVYGKSWMDFARIYERLSDEDDVELDSLPAEPEDERPRPSRPSPARVSEMETALNWPMEHLKASDTHRRVLKLWLRCKAERKSFRAAAKRRGWSEATAKRRRWQAVMMIATALMRDQVPAPALGPAHVFEDPLAPPAPAPSVSTFKVGDPVRAISEGQTFNGVVSSVQVKASGATRYVIRDENGFPRVFTERRLEARFVPETS